MANHKATKKSIRQIAKRDARNGSRMSRVRTFIKNLEKLVDAGDKKQAPAALKQVQSELQRAVSKGVVKQNTAARKLSRLNARVKTLVS
ncbi:MAG: 30S ribosomal protein S20 [Hyphomicrobiales bacterium]|nr:30S ribosomal protein S20 [Hyphomicrobiales bacterium]